MSSRINVLRRKPDAALVDQLEQLIEEVVDRLDRGEACEQLIATINALSGNRQYDRDTFFELYSAMDSRSFAETAAKGPAPVHDDLTREELIEVVQIFTAAPSEAGFFIEYLERNFPGSFSSDLIYWPHKEMTAEETVDELLLRERLYRESGQAAVHRRLVELARRVLADPVAPIWARQWAETIPT